MKKLLDKVQTNGSGPVIDLGEAGNVAIVHVWADGGAASVATVQLESVNDVSEPWAPAANALTAAAAIANPGSPGVFQVVMGRYIRATVSGYTSGVISASATVKWT